MTDVDDVPRRGVQIFTAVGEPLGDFTGTGRNPGSHDRQIDLPFCMITFTPRSAGVLAALRETGIVRIWVPCHECSSLMAAVQDGGDERCAGAEVQIASVGIGQPASGRQAPDRQERSLRRAPAK